MIDFKLEYLHTQYICTQETLFIIIKIYIIMYKI